MDALEFLKSGVNSGMQLPELVDVFEKMCQIPVDAGEEELILFETGTFSFSGHTAFHFSLARQFPNAGDEYFQVHLDLQYPPSDKNRLLSGAVWNEEVAGDFFAYVRGSEAYLSLKNDKILKISVYMEET